LSALGSNRAEQCFSDGSRITPLPAALARRQDANGQAIAYLYNRDNEDEARQAKVLTKDEARRIAMPTRPRELRRCHII
jgi:hypothetical protein